ncbi:hypothetical protein K1719_004361 [Acacia pycnantha]|nr:hypothetical protein K1719_004361 [Acacia pycnantha]
MMWKDKTTSSPPVTIFLQVATHVDGIKRLRSLRTTKPFSLHYFPPFCRRIPQKQKRRPSQHPLEMDGYIVIVYHFRGLLLRNDDGVVEYINGRVDELTEVDADYINLKDLESIFKGYGYEKCERIMWLKPGGEDYEARDDEAQDDEAEDPEEQCRPKKKKPARQSNDDSNEDVNEEETNEEEANDSFDENGYEYDSEELKTPRSSDDEGHDSETLAQFNEKAEFGHVNLELGMEFVSLEQFKNAVKDYNIESWEGIYMVEE